MLLWTLAEDGWQRRWSDLKFGSQPFREEVFLCVGQRGCDQTSVVAWMGAGPGWQMGVTLWPEHPAPAALSLLSPIVLCIFTVPIYYYRENSLFSTCYTNNRLNGFRGSLCEYDWWQMHDIMFLQDRGWGSHTTALLLLELWRNQHLCTQIRGWLVFVLRSGRKSFVGWFYNLTGRAGALFTTKSGEKIKAVKHPGVFLLPL